MLDLLVGARELTAAAGARFLFPRRGFPAHHVGVQWARAFLREMIRLGVRRPLVKQDVHHLGNDIAGPLNDDSIAAPYVPPLAQLLAVAADALDVVFIMQRDV